MSGPSGVRYPESVCRDHTFLRPRYAVACQSYASSRRRRIIGLTVSKRQTSGSRAKPSDKLEEYRWPNLSSTEKLKIYGKANWQARHLQAAMNWPVSPIAAAPWQESSPALVNCRAVNLNHCGWRQVTHERLTAASAGRDQWRQASYHNRFIAIPRQVLFIAVRSFRINGPICQLSDGHCHRPERGKFIPTPMAASKCNFTGIRKGRPMRKPPLAACGAGWSW